MKKITALLVLFALTLQGAVKDIRVPQIVSGTTFTNVVVSPTASSIQIYDASKVPGTLALDTDLSAFLTAGTLASLNTALGVTLSTFDGSALNASNLSSGTVPDARFPATLPAISGANLTGITAGNITASTTVGRALLDLTNPSAITFLRVNADNTVTARSAANFLADIGGIDGSALNASNLSSGTVPDARFPATLPAVSGANLTNITAGLSTNFLTGLVISSDSGDATNDIGISIGKARNSADTADMSLASAYVKQQDVAWAVGTAAGGMYQSANLAGTITTVSTTAVVGTSTTFTTDFVVGDVITSAGGTSRRIVTVTNDTNMVTESAMGTEAAVTYKRGGKAPNTAYYIYLIQDNAGPTNDVFFTTRNPSQTVTLPTGYDTSRLIGGFHNNATPAVDGVFMTDGFTASGYQTVAFTTTLSTNVDSGLQFYMAGNEVWTFEARSTITVPAAGVKFQVSAPASSTVEGYVSMTAAAILSTRFTAINTMTGAANTSGSTQSASFIALLSNSSTAGVVAIGFASVTGTQTSVMSAKSYFTARRR